MQIKGVLGKIDKLICSYLGVKQEEIHPTAVQITGNQLKIINTISFKRHVIKESWDNFIKHTDSTNSEKLGQAIGKVIAKNLVVSFEEPLIRNIQNEE